MFIELLGKMPKKILGNGRFCKDFFNRHGELRHIKSLRFWPLDKVLTEKYSMPEAEVSSMFGRNCCCIFAVTQNLCYVMSNFAVEFDEQC